MNAELLYEALNDRHSLEQLSVNDLGRLVNSHPYFSIGQLLLAKKQRQNNDKDSYQKQREHLHAFFRNPWWLYYQVELADHTATPAYIAQVPYRFESAPFESIARGASAATPTSAPVSPAATAPAPLMPTAPEADASPAPEPEARLVRPETHLPTPEPHLPTPEAHLPTAEAHLLTPELEAHVGSPVMETQSAPAAHPATLMAVEEPHRNGFVPWPGMEEDEEIPTLMGAGEPTGEMPVSATQEATAVHEVEPFLPYMVTSAVEALPEEPVVAVAAVAAAVEPVEPVVSAAAVPEPVVSVAAVPEPVALPPVEDFGHDIRYGDQDEETGDPDDTDGPEVAPVQRDDTPEPPPAFPTAEPAPFPFSLTPLTHDFTFEPLHTVDYFASQGIKLNLDDLPADSFGRHLKSFTDWLKSMKRIHPMEDRHADLDAATEAEIQQLASSANQQRDAILTESMAHVWVLQGKIHKAVEVYNKLSLQHPEKRAYFAAKIEQLNKL